MTSECPKCKSPVAREGQRFCYRCGHELPEGKVEKGEAGSGTPAATDKKAPEKPAATDKPAAQDQANAASSSTDVATPSASDPAKAGTSATDPSTSSQQAGATEVLSTDTTQVIVDTSPTAAAPGPDAVLRILLPTGDLFDKDLFHVD